MAALPENSVTRPEAPVATPERPMIDVILDCLDDAKAEEVVSVDITGKSSLADHMVVASGRSQRHVGAVADQMITKRTFEEMEAKIKQLHEREKEAERLVQALRRRLRHRMAEATEIVHPTARTAQPRVRAAWTASSSSSASSA